MNNEVGIKLEEVEKQVFHDGNCYEPVQPDSSEKLEQLKELVKDEIYPKFIELYGGENRSYERFLIGRDFDVEKASKMMKDAVQFRKERNLDGEKTEEELQQEEKYREQLDKLWILRYWGFSTDGHPMAIANVRNLNLKELLKIPEEDIKTYYLNWINNSFMLQNFTNSPPRRTQEDKKWKANIQVINLKGISMGQLHITGLKLLRKVLKLGQGLNPENIDKSYIINVPWFFSGAWGIIKQALNKQILAKITVSSGNCKDELMKHLGSEELYNDFMNT